MPIDKWPGKPYPLGATYDGFGVNVAVMSTQADAIELCLFDDAGVERRIELPEMHGYVWHGYFPALPVGQRYGFRVHGRWDPDQGYWCNPAKLLADPYGRAFEGGVTPHAALLSFDRDDPDRPSTLDSAPYVPRSIIVNPYFDWSGDERPHTPWSESIVYEMHTKGATMRHPDIDPHFRGTYLGVSQPAFIEHLHTLGITAVELLPVHQFVHDTFLQDRGLRNYWGYNTLGFFAPHNEYAVHGQRGEQVQDFRQMVKTLHQAGIEVILDVVYNHTCEGNHLGPTLGFRGFDNAYYRTVPGEPRHYFDTTGCGNSINMHNAFVLQLVMDSLRYWVTEMHVDGFRFDLAATLARENGDVTRLSAFFDLVQQDPVISQVKLIAEPWDIGWGGYQVGNFPHLWAEWNGRYRDSVRDFWRTTDGTLPEFTERFAGSSDLYADDGRRPYASVNFVTAHDGFTLRDLVSYNGKHNEANGENNRDGTDDNRSWNCGAEGATSDPKVLELRRRQERNFLATLFLSQGIPMLQAGDELGWTKGGNNNSYCQDNDLSWWDWSHADPELFAFTAGLAAMRRKHAVFRRRRFFSGKVPTNGSLPDIVWLRPDGTPMTGMDWSHAWGHAFAAFLNGEAIPSTDDYGQPIVDDSFLCLFNGHQDPVLFRLPPSDYGELWTVVLDTRGTVVPDPSPRVPAGGSMGLLGRSMAVLTRPRTSTAHA